MEDSSEAIPGCADCGQSLWHCHGTLIVHRSLERECSDRSCVTLRRDVHAVILSCRELEPPCGC